MENRRLAATEHDGVVLAVAVEVDGERWFSRRCGLREQHQADANDPGSPARGACALAHAVREEYMAN